MPIISKEQAVCIFYCQAYNESNVAELTKRIEEMKDVDICYLEDPTEPILACIITINSRPFRYHLYPTGIPRADDNQQEENKVQFVSHAQIIQFLNITYLPSDPMNEEVYECKSLTNSDILSMVWKYTDLFDEKTVVSFGQWCVNKVDFTAAHSKRKQCDSGKVSVRSLFVAKEQYIAKKVLDYLPHYQLFVQNLKKERYNIVGYARKSRTNENDESRIRLLQQMTRRLKERSLVDKIFVSPRANANELMVERDLIKNEDLLKQLNVDGDAQDLLNYINKNKKICLIILGYAGLSTNCKDLETFLRRSLAI
ncbi:hypothetical protein G6F37_012940 [Rhizopus arrhizus]|nr:hypothetical protein G6F37_012940 [Rhizopus arrhizus]